MKKVFLLMALMLPMMFCGCSKDEDKEDGFEARNVTANELESGTGVYEHVGYNTTYYIKFENGNLTSYEYKSNKFEDIRLFEYSIEGDKLNLIKRPFMEEILGGESEYYTLKIRMYHYGNDKEDQLMITGDNAPYNFYTGWYEKSIVEL
ncbi:MAG: hypothetical protein ACLRPS_04790 [Paraprevotella clara]|uniref:Lipoprotein n=1 Tax=Paraprevotella clara TaxID=454154 RepID=A0A6N3ESL5_9BACT